MRQREADDALALLDEHICIRVRGCIEREVCERFVRGVYEGRSRWNSDFNAVQFSLGRAWYTHLEQERSREYFAKAADSDRDVERFAPGLQSLMRELAGDLIHEPVHTRRGWCGPGVHVFPAGGLLSREGGDVHFDLEGLSDAHASERAPAFTIVLMLQPPIEGGELKLWDFTFDGEHHECDLDDEDLDCDTVMIPYEVGDLLVIDSYRLHQIQPFRGERDRVSATLHTARVAGRWESWF
ncbi:MAG: hypothetical protein U0165_07065 [Polyangiaceae bacterium]